MSKPQRDKQPHAVPATLEEKVEEIHERLVRDKSSELYGVLDILGNRRKLMWLNFNAGLARGVGFFLGVTLVGALILGALTFAFNKAVEHMGFKDMTLEEAVRQATIKFSEVKEIVEETKEEVEAEKEQEHAAEPNPLAPTELPPLPPKPEPPQPVPPR